MKLYYAPGTCSLAPHIILRETNTPFELVKTDIRAKKTEDGRNFLDINPNGYVPVLELDDGTRLTEGAAIMQFIADRADATSIAPPNGTLERYKMQSWLNFISTELHKGFSPLFNPNMPENGKAVARENLLKRIKFVDEHLAKNEFLMGNSYTVPDAYAFAVLSWTRPLKIDISEFKNVTNYLAKLAERPAVKAAMKAEGLIK